MSGTDAGDLRFKTNMSRSLRYRRFLSKMLGVILGILCFCSAIVLSDSRSALVGLQEFSGRP